MKLSPDFILRTVCGETMLMPVGENTKRFNGIFTLSETGAFLLDAVTNGATQKEAAERLSREFDIPHDVAESDASEFFAQLAEYGVLS